MPPVSQSGRRSAPGSGDDTGAPRGAAPARVAAYTVLRRVFEDGAYAPQALNACSSRLDARDRALARRLAYGAVQRRLTLDTVISRLARRSVERVDAPLLAALRLGCYEILYSDGAPSYAVVDDAVRLARAVAPRGAGLVNAVLRRAVDEAPGILASYTDAEPEGAAVIHSHPRWIVELLWTRLGPDGARATLAADNEPGELALRANTLRTTLDDLEAELGVPCRRDPLIPDALVVQGQLDIHASAPWREGRCIAQSRAAMLVALALAPRAGERVLDLCAAPGGKTTHLAALMGGEGTVVAVESNPKRAKRLGETVERLGLPNVEVSVADARSFSGGTFDRVLVDPPCSGLGTLQFRPDLRWRVSEQDLPGLIEIQRSVLSVAAAALRPGGMLVYSTCTIGTDENERMTEEVLRDPSLAAADLGDVYPPARGDLLDGTVQTLPGRDATAGFYIAGAVKT